MSQDLQWMESALSYQLQGQASQEVVEVVEFDRLRDEQPEKKRRGRPRKAV